MNVQMELEFPNFIHLIFQLVACLPICNLWPFGA